jgi:hypothetical protein
MTWAKKVDLNQAEIVETLRQTGMSVLILSRVGQGCPDLLVGFRNHNYLLEVKRDHCDLTVPETDFFLTWKGQKAICRTAEQAVDLIMDDCDE